MANEKNVSKLKKLVKPPKDKKARASAPRFGIAEWYGKNIDTMSPEERISAGASAFGQVKRIAIDVPVLCPHLSALVPDAKCNKAGGACSMRKYGTEDRIYGTPIAGQAVATMCPSRFIEENIIFKWVGEKMLGISDPIVVKETPFLRKTKINALDNESEKEDDPDDDKKRAGRIDWLLIDPRSVGTDNLKWCALETQALYFSGGKMEEEFNAYAKSNGEKLLYPVAHRRPDYRSNGPKRLAPQLAVKVPVLRSWGTKVAVVVDRYFYDQMGELKPAFARATTEKAKLDHAEVVWFVMDYDDNMNLRQGDIIYTDLAKSVEALNATEPIEKDAFHDGIKSLLNDAAKQGAKWFKIL